MSSFNLGVLGKCKSNVRREVVDAKLFD